MAELVSTRILLQNVLKNCPHALFDFDRPDVGL